MKTFNDFLNFKESGEVPYERAVGTSSKEDLSSNFHFANAEVEIDGNKLNIYSKTNQAKISIELSSEQISKLTQEWIKSKGEGGYGVYPNASYYVYGDPHLEV